MRSSSALASRSSPYRRSTKVQALDFQGLLSPHFQRSGELADLVATDLGYRRLNVTCGHAPHTLRQAR